MTHSDGIMWDTFNKEHAKTWVRDRETIRDNTVPWAGNRGHLTHQAWEIFPVIQYKGGHLIELEPYGQLTVTPKEGSQWINTLASPSLALRISHQGLPVRSQRARAHWCSPNGPTSWIWRGKKVMGSTWTPKERGPAVPLIRLFPSRKTQVTL